MKTLLVSATKREIQPLLSSFKVIGEKNNLLNYSPGKNHSLDILITGVGMVAMAYHLGKTFMGNHYGLALNLGIGGSFGNYYPEKNSTEIKLGQVVNVVSDRFSELGIEEGEDWVSMADLGLMHETEHCFSTINLCPGSHITNSHPIFSHETLLGLPRVAGVTVNKIDTNEKNIKKAVERFRPMVESMEGAAFMYACFKAQIPCLQIRGISNYVGVRNKEEWDISLAVENLNKTVLELL